MIFFDNCCSILRGRQYLSIGRALKLRIRPPRSYPIFLFCIVFLLLSSSKAYANQITLSLKSVPLETAFEEIKKQSGYGFWYEKKDLEGLTKVSVSVNDAGLKQALELCLKGQPLRYEIFDKTVVVKRKAALPVAVPIKRALQEKIRGKVVDAQTKEPLAGVLVKVLSPVMSVVTDDKGFFELNLLNGNYEVAVQYMGYGTRELVVAVPMTGDLVVALMAGEQSLAEVQVINTGYQSLSKERSTGSFVKLGEDLINRSVGTSLIDRMDGVTSGLIFTKGNSVGAPRSSIEIRGRSTLFSNAEPLVILDNFPYDGDYQNINPNDIESISVLKDAAAAAAWGARSGNGVIVITTKKGRRNTKAKFAFNTNLSRAGKTDLYYRPQVPTSDYIAIQRQLFDQGSFNSLINNGFSELPGAVELFMARRNGTISQESLEQSLSELSSYDQRTQALDYYYQNAIQRQFQVSLAGGGNDTKYFLSVGRDDNSGETLNNDYGRLTFQGNQTYFLLDNRLELYTGINYTVSRSNIGANINSVLKYPYTRLADDDGQALVVPYILRPSFAANAGNGRLLDWLYRPLDELRNNYNATIAEQADMRLNTSLNYKIFSGLKFGLFYTFQKVNSESNKLDELASIYTRNSINSLAQINQSTGIVTYPMPIGDILSYATSVRNSQNGRVQLGYEKRWDTHGFSGLVGMEIKELKGVRNALIYYGYDQFTGSNQNRAVNYTTQYPYFYGAATGQIAPGTQHGGSTDRFISSYFLGSYSFQDKYSATLTVRRDESNIFGVAANQKGVPLWSAGIAWMIDKEKFFPINMVEQLKLRATYGYTGNVNNTLSAYLTSIIGTSTQTYNSVYTRIVNPPNPSLRWERVSNLNLGLDFRLKNGWMSGSVDLWRKNGLDLIGNSPVAPQTGISLLIGNAANTITKGIDLQLNSINLDGNLKWQTVLLYNLAVSKVTDYKVSNGSNINVVSSNYNNPLVGYPYYAIFSFKYAGLDGTGNPLGYLNGAVSTDYGGIRNSVNRNDLFYHGSAVPTSFGSIRNDFNFKRVGVSFNIGYKFGYYFRRSSINGNLYSTGGSNFQMYDYERRWQKPGDEQYTFVPSIGFPTNANRLSVFTYSTALVEKGDHIRLQDIRISYDIRSNKGFLFKKAMLYAHVNNLGILWRSNKYGIDPDAIIGYPMPKAVALGLRSEF